MIKRRMGGDSGGQEKEDELGAAKTILKVLIIVGIIFWVAPYLLFNTELDEKLVDECDQDGSTMTPAVQERCVQRLLDAQAGKVSVTTQISKAAVEGKTLMVMFFDVVKYALLVAGVGTIAYMRVSLRLARLGMTG